MRFQFAAVIPGALMLSACATVDLGVGALADHCAPEVFEVTTTDMREREPGENDQLCRIPAEGGCTIRAAIRSANLCSGSGGSQKTVRLQSGRTYSALLPDVPHSLYRSQSGPMRTRLGLEAYPIIWGNVLIEGNGATVEQSGRNRLFIVAASATLEIRDATLARGHLSVSPEELLRSGGCVLNEGTVKFTRVDFRQCEGGSRSEGVPIYPAGAAILNLGVAEIVGGSFSGGGWDGTEVIANRDTLSISGGTIFRGLNRAAISNGISDDGPAASLRLDTVTFDDIAHGGNRATVLTNHHRATATAVNITITDCSLDRVVANYGTLTLAGSTIVRNDATELNSRDEPLIGALGGSTTVSDTVIQGNFTGPTTSVIACIRGPGSGGASAPELVLDGVQITDNRALPGAAAGGLVVSTGCRADVRATTITSNSPADCAIESSAASYTAESGSGNTDSDGTCGF